MESAYDLLVEGIDAIRAIRPAPYGLIIPGDALLGDDAAIEISHLDTPVLMLKDSLESVESLDIDYCIIDCPPNLGFVTRNAMAASDEIIVVVRPDKFSRSTATQVFRRPSSASLAISIAIPIRRLLEFYSMPSTGTVVSRVIICTSCRRISQREWDSFVRDAHTPLRVITASSVVREVGEAAIYLRLRSCKQCRKRFRGFCERILGIGAGRGL